MVFLAGVASRWLADPGREELLVRSILQRTLLRIRWSTS